MSKANNKPTIFIVLIAVTAILSAVLFYFSPYLTLNALKNAAINADKEKMAQLVDFPSLRENVKIQVMGAITKSMEKEKDNPFAALGMMMGGGIADNFINTYITPDGIADMLKRKVDKDEAAIKANPKASISKPQLKWINSKVAYISFVDKNAPNETTTLELKRVGLFSWQLKGIDFPESQFETAE